MRNTSNLSSSLQSLLVLLQLANLSVILSFIAGERVPPFVPIEDITIDCGSFSDTVSLDGRSWSGESNSKFPAIHSESKQSVFLSAFTGHAPYITTRLSYSEFTYMIPLTAGQKFIRLHFHLNSYPGFDLSKAFFSVKAGPFTLLRNFSALLHARGKQTLVKEFCVNLEDAQSLNITFTPSYAMSDAYAFINGIEIVSMPTNLYYTDAIDDKGLTFLGEYAVYILGIHTALEMMHQISTGGKQISPAEDTGMYRSWSSDDDYLTVGEPSVIPVNSAINLHFADVPPYVARISSIELLGQWGPTRL